MISFREIGRCRGSNRFSLLADRRQHSRRWDGTRGWLEVSKINTWKPCVWRMETEGQTARARESQEDAAS